MTVKRKSAYYLIAIVLICATTLFVVIARYNGSQQDASPVQNQSTSEDVKVVQENNQSQSEKLEQTTADTSDTSVENKEVGNDTEVVVVDTDTQDDDSTIVENTIDEDVNETPIELSSNEVWDSEARKIPDLTTVHLLHQDHHYTKVLDDGTIFDSRNSRQSPIPPGAVVSGTLEDIDKTIRELEKMDNKSDWVNAYIETLKRAGNPNP